MNQIIPFNQSQGGSVPNFCLANVIKGYGIGAKYPDAWTAWLNTEQHGGDAPAGLDVPVFFSYVATIDGVNKNWGHIGVRLANGQFWSDGKVYATIAAYTANHAPKYVGWGESINNVTVIGQGEVMINDSDTDILRIGHSEIGGWAMNDTHSGKNDATFHAAWNGKDLREFIRTQWANGADFRNARVRQMGEYPSLVAQVDSLTKENTFLKAQLATKPNGGLTPEQATQLSQTSTDVSWIRSLLNRVFK